MWKLQCRNAMIIVYRSAFELLSSLCAINSNIIAKTDACVATNNEDNGSDGNFYCINGGEIGGTTGTDKSSLNVDGCCDDVIMECEDMSICFKTN